MDHEELYAAIVSRPFQPFRIHVTDGSSYDVTHPDQIILRKRVVHVGVSLGANDPTQSIVVVSLLHISRLVPIVMAGATSS